jgi:hypothetical protein
MFTTYRWGPGEGGVRFSANYGLWVGYLSRGEAGHLRATTEVILRDIEGKQPSPEAAVARRSCFVCAGMVSAKMAECRLAD